MSLQNETQADVKLKITNICKMYGKKTILKNLTFEVRKGQVAGFLGPNGAGKSTTIKIIAGLVAPTSGTVEINGVETTHCSHKVFEKLGIMFEAPSFYNYLSAYKNLEILCRFLKKHSIDINETLETVGLSEFSKVKVGEYSQGMRQRLGIAQAILAKPETLILDEPTNSLDPAGKREMKDLIKNMAQREKITVFLSSHLLAEMEEICSRVIIIDRGEIIASKDIIELQREGVTSLEQYFLDLTQKGEKHVKSP
jgi:ABC-2 type transport system ATP-binding protein